MALTCSVFWASSYRFALRLARHETISCSIEVAVSVLLNSRKADCLSMGARLSTLAFCLLRMRVNIAFSSCCRISSSWVSCSSSQCCMAAISASFSFVSSILVTGFASRRATPKPNSPASSSSPTRPSRMVWRRLNDSSAEATFSELMFSSMFRRLYPSYLSFMNKLRIWLSSSLTWRTELKSSMSSYLPVKKSAAMR